MENCCKYFINKDMRNKIQICPWIILKSCIILSSIVFSLMIVSCSTPNSVRSGKQLTITNSKEEQRKNEFVKKDEKEQIQEAEKLFEKMSKNNKSNFDDDIIRSDEPFNTNTSRKIPSLREQMKIYTEQQDRMLDKLTFLERDVDNIKNDIEDIKVTIRSILESINHKTATGIYGEEKIKNKDYQNENNQTGFYLYPDEQNEPSTGNDSEKNIKQNNSEQMKNKRKEITKNNNSIQTEKPAERKKIVADINNEKKIQITTKSQEFELAMDFLTKRDYQSAVEELTKLENKQKNPSEKFKTYYWLGESYFGLGNYSKAIDYFRKVLKSGDSYKKDYATIMIAESYLRIGRVEDAKKSYAKFVDEFPNSNQIPRAKKMLQQL